MRLGRSKGSSGFTLVEVLAALSIFAIVTVGIGPVLVSSLRASSISRTYTVGKNVAVEAMERARGFPFYVAFPTQQGYTNNLAPFRKVDLLDLYFPSYVASGEFVTTCSTGSTNPACPLRYPAGYSVEFRARFVQPVATPTGETYNTVVPPAGYRWNPDPYFEEDQPPSQLLEMTVIARWAYGGRARQTQLSTILGERAFGEVTVDGDAKIDYGIQVTTNYTETTGRTSQLRAVGGISKSLVETKTTSTADVSVRSALFELVTTPDDPTIPAETLATFEGALSAHHAPPDGSPVGDSDGGGTLTHPDTTIPFCCGGLDSTTTSDLKVSVTQELPTAEGTFNYFAGGSNRLFFANPQIDVDTMGRLRLDPANMLVRFAAVGSVPFRGTTTAVTVPVNSGSRGVDTNATLAFNRLRILPTSYISSGLLDILGITRTERSVVVIDNFQASTRCKASGLGSAVVGVKSWSATLYFWQDLNPADGSPIGAYTQVDLSSGNSSDPLQIAVNPLVYDGSAPKDDIYLFDRPAAGQNGYFRSMSSTVGNAVSISDGGRKVQASIDAAIRLETVPTDADLPNSGLSIQIGKLSCSSVDER